MQTREEKKKERESERERKREREREREREIERARERLKKEKKGGSEQGASRYLMCGLPQTLSASSLQVCRKTTAAGTQLCSPRRMAETAALLAASSACRLSRTYCAKCMHANK